MLEQLSGENAELQLPRSPWGAEMVLVSSLVSSLGGPVDYIYQILMLLYETQMLVLRTSCLHQLLIYRCHNS